MFFIIFKWLSLKQRKQFFWRMGIPLIKDLVNTYLVYFVIKEKGKMMKKVQAVSCCDIKKTFG